jgi:signal transduction histidine kinase
MSRRARILLVDDDPAILTVTAHSLRQAGYDVTEASTVRDCLRLAREATPDLLLLDVVLPDGNGVEACQQLKRDPATEPLFIVLLSNFQISSQNQIAGLESGADGYIARPIETRELLARVEAMLRIQQAEANLRQANAGLERRVAERTAALSDANAALRQEIEVRRAAEASARRLSVRLQSLREIDLAILQADTPENIAAAVLRRIRNLLPCELAGVFELDGETGQAVVLAVFEQGHVAAGGGRRLTNDQLERSPALQSGEPRRVARSRGLLPLAPTHPEASDKVWRWLIDIPLMAEAALIGALQLATDTPDAFTDEHQEIAIEIGARLAVALRQARLFEQVSAARERLRALSLRLVEVQEAERRFLARELHDEIGQALTSLRLSLELHALPQASESLRPGLQEALDIVNDLTRRVRQLSLDLRPPMLDDLGLLTALPWFFKRYSQQTGVQVQFKHTPLASRLAAAVETAVFRIVQEALTNVARHAGVKDVAVRLLVDSAFVTVQIEDKGGGFDPARALAAGATSGLAGMQERALLLGGEFSLESAPGRGTCLTVSLPQTPAAAPAPATP